MSKHKFDPQEPEPRWLRIAAAERYSGISRAKLYILMAEGKLPSVSVALTSSRGTRLIDRLAIDKFLEGLQSSDWHE
jgi:predicted DNA-binding transcriptional regulator AlpA